MSVLDRARSRIPPWLGNPLTTALLVGLLLADLTVLRPAAPPALSVQRHLYAARVGESVRIIDPATESWDELSRLIADPESPVTQVRFGAWTVRSGVWAATSERSFRGFARIPVDGRWSDAAETAVRDALEERAAAAPEWHWLARNRDVIDEGEEHRTVLWGGVARSVGAVVVGGCVMLSLAGWPAWVGRRRWSKRNRRAARGQCLACGYDLRELESDRCPECGEVFTLPNRGGGG